ncbi:MAG: MATE family efflux transporter [Pirellulaceae bacterium]|nr:MATE family efflux transporter [Pirellulaceae bacterium]
MLKSHPVTSRNLSTWWKQPAGGREVLLVSLPLVISSLSWTVMTFVDRIFLKWLSGDSMAAAFTASTVWFVLLCLPLGICAYANTFVSQYFGDRQYKQIGLAVWQAIWVALVVSPFILAFNPLVPQLFELAGHTPAIRSEEIRYFQALNWGAAGMLVSQAAAAFYSGRGKTRIVMVVDSFFAVLNAVLDYVWIFGYWGFPAAGIAGAGYATAVALTLKAIVYLVLMLREPHRAEFGTGIGCRFDWSLFKKMCYFGGPSGLQMLLDVVGFSTFIVLVARLGNLEAEATSMAFSISTLAFMPIWGFGMGAGILVGQHLGENQPDLAARASWNSLALGIGYMSLISVLYIVVPTWFLWWFFAGTEHAHGLGSDVGVLATKLLQFVAAYNLLDATLTILVSAIKGAGDTRFVLGVSLVMGLVLAVSSWLAVEVWQFGIYGCWALIVAWVWALGIIYLLRFIQGKWRDMRVIDMTHSAPLA